ncbi:PKHG7 protein, partial [Amia calva]|nr:PKHG7 protein [Amia calva]
MRLDSTRASSRQNHASSLEIDGLVTPLFQFDRQAPARISTSPTLRRMRRSTRRPQMDFRDPGKETPEPNLSHSKSTGNITYHGSQTSPGNTQTCPVAGSLPNCFPEEFLPEHLPSVSPSDGKKDEFNAHSLNNGVIGRMLEPQSARESVRPTQGWNGLQDYHQAACLQERRRSSVVVSLPGLDVSPGDLFVSDGAADYLSQSTFSDTKKSKWPFSKRWTAKDKMKLLCDVEKCLSSVHIQDWRNCDFQQYKDSTLAEFLKMHHREVEFQGCPQDYRREEAVWELFTSECVYFLDQLMVLKEVFLSTLTDLQSKNCLLDVDVWRLFANLNELCLVSFGFLNHLLHAVKESWELTDTKSPTSLRNLLTKASTAATVVFQEGICYCQQKYCLNYSSAVFYLDNLKQREDFGTYLKWCERNEQCRRLHLTDLLVAPMQRFTRYPLLLKNIGKRSSSEEDKSAVQSLVELVERSIQDLEGKVKWLDSFQKVQRLKEMIIWPSFWEQHKRAFIPENLKYLLKPVTPESLITHHTLLHEGRLVLAENAKLQDIYLFLFDEFLLITKIKRSKKKSLGSELNSLRLTVNQELQGIFKEGGTFTVLDQPISVDRLQIKNIDQLNTTVTGLHNSFILMHQNRYQQCIGVFILQAQSESVKKTWISEIEKAMAALSGSDSQKKRGTSTSLWVESSQI